MVQHEGYGAGFFVSDLLPPSALALVHRSEQINLYKAYTRFEYCLGRFLVKPLLVLA